MGRKKNKSYSSKAITLACRHSDRNKTSVKTISIEFKPMHVTWCLTLPSFLFGIFSLVSHRHQLLSIILEFLIIPTVFSSILVRRPRSKAIGRDISCLKSNDWRFHRVLFIPIIIPTLIPSFHCFHKGTGDSFWCSHFKLLIRDGAMFSLCEVAAGPHPSKSHHRKKYKVCTINGCQQLLGGGEMGECVSLRQRRSNINLTRLLPST